MDGTTFNHHYFTMNKQFEPYILEDASDRIENILNMVLSDVNLSDKLPTSDDLKIQSVRYAYGSVVCVKYEITNNNTTYKMILMRLIASEFYNILKSHEGITNITVVGDTLIALYDTPLKSDIDKLLEIVAKLNAITKFFNFKIPFINNGRSSLKVKIAMHYSSLSICPLGYSFEDSNDICYMGDALTKTKKMVESSDDKDRNTIFVTQTLYNNLKKDYQAFFSKCDKNTYSSDVINTAINSWTNK